MWHSRAAVAPLIMYPVTNSPGVPLDTRGGGPHRDTPKECIRRNAPNAPLERFRPESEKNAPVGAFDGPEAAIIGQCHLTFRRQPVLEDSSRFMFDIEIPGCGQPSLERVKFKLSNENKPLSLRE